MVSMGLMYEPQNMPLVGYQLLPSLYQTTALLKQAFKFQKSKDGVKKGSTNLMDSLQVLTTEGIDFSREKVFETPHPYPQTDYS